MEQWFCRFQEWNNAGMAATHLDDMALFVEVVRAGSFNRAAARLGLPNATLSRRIAAMEQRLGLRLFERSTRRVQPSGAALRFYERCAPLVDEARLAHEALHERAFLPEGHLRVSMPVDLGALFLGDALPEFLRQHPGITMDLDLSPRFVDLKTEPFDLALRIGSARGDGLVARRIGLVAQGVYAAPAYLERHGRPRMPAELAQHDCLVIGSAPQGARWRLAGPEGEASVAVRGPVGLNNMGLMCRLAERGVGVALLPQHLAQPAVARGTLERLFPRHRGAGWPLVAVTTSRLLPAAVRAFVDFIAARAQVLHE